MKAAASEDLRRFAHCAGFSQRHGVFLHNLLKGEGVVQRGVHGAFIGLEGIAKADAQDVAPGDDAHKLVAIDDRDVVHPVLAYQGAHLGNGVAVMCGDHAAGHDVGDGIVSFHG